jgi:hypothetical protein
MLLCIWQLNCIQLCSRWIKYKKCNNYAYIQTNWNLQTWWNVRLCQNLLPPKATAMDNLACLCSYILFSAYISSFCYTNSINYIKVVSPNIFFSILDCFSIGFELWRECNIGSATVDQAVNVEYNWRMHLFLFFW